MDLVRMADVEAQEKLFEEAMFAASAYAKPKSKFDRRVLDAAKAVQEASTNDEQKVIDLPTTIGRAWGKTANYGTPPDWPRIAVVDARFATRMIRVRSYRDGTAYFGGWVGGRRIWTKLPAGTDPSPDGARWVTQAETMAPPIPPKYRELVKPGILLMWQSENWRDLGRRKHEPPPPAPVDPALLQRMGDSWLYKVIAEWELTEIERRCMIPV